MMNKKAIGVSFVIKGVFVLIVGILILSLVLPKGLNPFNTIVNKVKEILGEAPEDFARREMKDITLPPDEDAAVALLADAIRRCRWEQDEQDIDRHVCEGIDTSKLGDAKIGKSAVIAKLNEWGRDDEVAAEAADLLADDWHIHNPITTSTPRYVICADHWTWGDDIVGLFFPTTQFLQHKDRCKDRKIILGKGNVGCTTTNVELTVTTTDDLLMQDEATEKVLSWLKQAHTYMKETRIDNCEVFHVTVPSDVKARGRTISISYDSLYRRLNGDIQSDFEDRMTFSPILLVGGYKEDPGFRFAICADADAIGEDDLAIVQIGKGCEEGERFDGEESWD